MRDRVTGASGRYDAFVSYSHRQDRPLAIALQWELQQFARPWYRTRALRIFRDETNLAASPGLWPKIEHALSLSDWFILMACPASAESDWVRREVDWWKANRPADRILVALTAGSIAWDGGDFDWTQTDAVPLALSGVFTHEPHWIDLRKVRPAEDADIERVERPRLGDVVAEFAAPIHGQEKDDLIGEHVRQRRRTVRRVRAVIATLTLLLMVAVSGGVVANQQRNVAQKQTLAATSRQLVAQAIVIQDSQPELARQLLVEAYRLSPTDQAVGALLGAAVIPRVIHTDSLPRGAVFSPVGDILAVATDKGVTMYRTADGKVQSEISGQQGYAGALAFSADGHYLAVGDAAGEVRLFDATEPRSPAELDRVRLGSGIVEGLAFNPQASLLVVTGQRAFVAVLDVRKPGLVPVRATIEGFDTAGLNNPSAVSPDGRMLVSNAFGDVVRIWDMRDPKHLRPGASLSGTSNTLAYQPTGNLLAVGGDDGIALWDLGDSAHPKAVATLAGQSRGVNAVAFSPDGLTLAAGAGDGSIQLWSLSDPVRPVAGERLTGHSDGVVGVSFSPDGRVLASVSGDGSARGANGIPWKGVVRLWNLVGADRSSALAALPAGELTVPAFSPDSRLLATGFPTTLWDITTRARPRPGARVPTFNQGSAAVAFDPGGRYLVTGMPIEMWDVTDQDAPRKLTQSRLIDGPQVLLVKPSGGLVVAGVFGAEVEMWDVTRPEQPERFTALPGSRAEAQTAAFTRAGDLFATADHEGGVQLWNLARPTAPRLRGTVRLPSGRVAALAFASDTGVLLTGDTTGEVTTWDVSNPATPVRLGSAGRHVGTVGGLAFHPSRAIAASAGDDGSVRLWAMDDPAHPVEMATLQAGGLYDPAHLAFSADGRTLAAADAAAVQLWDMDVTGILGVLCAHSSRITPGQWAQYLPDQSYDPPCL